MSSAAFETMQTGSLLRVIQAGDVRPQPDAKTTQQEGSMDATTTRGRPRAADSDHRRKQFVRLIVNGEQFAEAARQARIQPLRALAILDELEAAQLIARAA